MKASEHHILSSIDADYGVLDLNRDRYFVKILLIERTRVTYTVLAKCSLDDLREPWVLTKEVGMTYSSLASVIKDNLIPLDGRLLRLIYGEKPLGTLYE